MRKMMTLFSILVMVAGPAAISSADSSPQTEIDALVVKWLWAISHEYVDGYANCYWPDATDETYDNKGQSSLLVGVESLRQRQQKWADSTDFSKLDLTYPEPTRFLPGTGDICVYSYVLKQFKQIEIFYFQRRGGEYRILRQIDLYYQ